MSLVNFQTVFEDLKRARELQEVQSGAPDDIAKNSNGLQSVYPGAGESGDVGRPIRTLEITTALCKLVSN